MREALIDCAIDLFRLIDQGRLETQEARELRDLIRYYFGQLPRDEKRAVLKEVIDMRRTGRWRHADEPT